MKAETHQCPVCLANEAQPFVRVGERSYWRCQQCLCTFLEAAQLPAVEIERAEYDKHENDVDDPGYRRFLARLADPLLERLNPASQGLDYGCGPGPALGAMMNETGHQMALYDPIYAPDAAALEKNYDFVTCTEVVEHFHHPAREFERLDALLRPGGWLGIMTRFQTDDARFASWHYRRDPTHVVFYREETMEWLGQRYGWKLEIRPPGIVIAQKSLKTHNLRDSIDQ